VRYVKQKLDCFCNLKVVPKDCEDSLHRWEAHETQYPIIGIFVQQNFDIVGSQIEMKRVLSTAGLITTLRQCHYKLGPINSCSEKLA
jgi:hypothetical protein